MLAAATTATQTTTAANTASIAAPTANNRNSSSTNMQSKKIVLYNPSIDYSAPLQQQINPEIIGAHPHAQQYQQQYSSGSGLGAGSSANNIHNTNQVRQPLQPLQPQQQQQQPQQAQAQQQSRLSAFTPVAAARLSLAGLAAAAATPATTQSSASISSSQQQQQQQQQLLLQQQMLATLPLKLSEQCNLSNLHLNSFVNEMGEIKSGLEQQQQQHNSNQVVGLLGRNGDSNGLLANSSVGSSISNLLISNNLTTAAATATAPAAAAVAVASTSGAGDAAIALLPTANKLNGLWSQSHATVAPYNINGVNAGSSILFGNQTSTSDAISSLWGCSPSSGSSGSSSTSGCSSGSGSQPSLSPTSTASTRPDYRSNSKEPLWSASQTSPNSSNTLRDTYYTTKAGVAITAANASGGGSGNNGPNNLGDSGQQSTSPSASSTCSSASSTCSSGLGSSAGIEVGVWPNCKLQSYFAADNCGAAQPDEAAQFAKISNIWEIPNPTAAATTRATTDLFTDLWCNNTERSSVAAGARVTSNTNADFDLAQPIDFTDSNNIWRTNMPATTSLASGNGAPTSRASTKQLPTTAVAAGNNNKGLRANIGTDLDNGGMGMSAAEADSNTACMQLFSEQFLNYINIINYAD